MFRGWCCYRCEDYIILDGSDPSKSEALIHGPWCAGPMPQPSQSDPSGFVDEWEGWRPNPGRHPRLLTADYKSLEERVKKMENILKPCIACGDCLSDCLSGLRQLCNWL